MVFGGYNSACRNGERWVTAEKFEAEKQRTRAYRQTDEGRIRHRKSNAKYHQKDGVKERIRARMRRYRQREEVRAKYREQNQRWLTTEEGRSYRRAYKARKRRTPEGRLVEAIRNSTNRAVKFAGRSKPSRSFELLGTDLEGFKAHIEAQFTDGMSWENHSEWHIDHIVPLASGKAPEEIWKLCHYTNLQPLWARDNMSKHAKTPDQYAK
jgi:hypothetical protein